jgi:hypothetical protein
MQAEREAAIKAVAVEIKPWWCNCNAVLTAFSRARSTVLNQLAAGNGKAQVRFRRYDGEFRITNQIQRGMSIETLLAVRHCQVQLLEPTPVQWGASEARRPGRQCDQRQAGSRRDRKVGRMILSATVFTRDDRYKQVRWLQCPYLAAPWHQRFSPTRF